MRPVLTRVFAPDETTAQLLRAHPNVAEVLPGEPDALRFDWERRPREVRVGPIGDGSSGLMELIDNNPVVCADRVGVPSAAGTLALIALGPIVQAGLLFEPPAMMTNAPGSADELARELESIEWREGIVLDRQDIDLGGVLAATVVAAIRMPEDLDDIDALYGERFGGSFFVRRDEDGPWDAANVKGRPEARYRLRVAPDSPVGLLTVQVMADRDGKCGACQLVHAMNIMCGFEESLGIGDFRF